MEIETIWGQFKPEQRLVREFDHWMVVVRAKQVTLGACLFLLKRGVPSLGDLTPDELVELAKVASWFESRAKAVFGAEKFNYVAAMMKDPYVHFHAFPRYAASLSRHGMVWRDDCWPKVIEFRDVSTPEEILTAVRDDLRVTD